MGDVVTAVNRPVKVDIWSDIACPWCFVGKRRFEQAVAAFEEAGGQVEVEYHSFELAPDTPVDFAGTEVDFLVQHKHMPARQVSQMLGQMTNLAAAEGLAYDFDALQHTNTALAHQLLHLAKKHGCQLDMKERLLSAYFQEGRHVGRIDDLADLAAEVDLDRDEVVQALTSGTFAHDVEADRERAVDYGIGGVPFYVIDARYAVSGAQDPAVFAEALRKAAATRPASDG
ncbi:DsbA family oxidoreductase [Aeromicrobium sp.]|uniref:DsbA family oxidoreductase n=1 Tax=Aeromicrobium sp. TaxID=1871063 RepID=UPI003C6F005D